MIIARLRTESTTDEERQYWDAFEIGEDVAVVSRQEMSTAVVDFLTDSQHRLDDSVSVINDNRDNFVTDRRNSSRTERSGESADMPQASLLSVLQEIRADVAAVKMQTQSSVQIRPQDKASPSVSSVRLGEDFLSNDDASSRYSSRSHRSSRTSKKRFSLVKNCGPADYSKLCNIQ